MNEHELKNRMDNVKALTIKTQLALSELEREFNPELTLDNGKNCEHEYYRVYNALHNVKQAVKELQGSC